MKKLLFLVSLFFASLSFSQQESEIPLTFKKNSFGLDVRNDYGYFNLGLNYRRFYENSKFNLRVNLYLGGEEGEYVNFSFSTFPQPFNSAGMLVAQTQDSVFPFIGINQSQPQTGSFQKLELGIERRIAIWKFNLIAGADVTLGHSFRSGYRDIVEAVLYTYNENGYDYYQFGERQADSSFNGSPINSLTVGRNYLSFGLLTRIGGSYNITDRLFATAFIGLRFEQELMVSESITYTNELFKDILTFDPGRNTFNLHSFASIGLHYKF